MDAYSCLTHCSYDFALNPIAAAGDRTVPARFFRKSSPQADGGSDASARVAADRSGSMVSSMLVEQARLRRCPASGP